jgi:hypothetical protein
MNPYNSAPAPKGDVIEFVPPAADVVRLVQLSIWRNRLDRKQLASGESPMPTSGKRVES